MIDIPTYGAVTPYPFQWEVIKNTKDFIRKQLKREVENQPCFINAYVSSGKTIIAGAIAVHCQNVGARLLVLARTGELVEQDAEEIFNMGGRCSIFSASLGSKSTHFSTVVGTEGTVANALDKDFAHWIPHIILIDESHEVHWEAVLNKTDNQYAKIINHFKDKNPNVVIVGMTGSPYRGVESIKGPFWKHEIEPRIDREFLVKNEYIMPTTFGYGKGEAQYDLSEFNSINEFGTGDFSAADLQAMAAKMGRDKTKLIMAEVVAIMQSRLCALITCAGAKHCEDAASNVPDDECAIVTDKTPKKERMAILRGAKRGELNERGTFRYKYIFQIGCLTTGVNIPFWCTSVLLRRIGSLTLLTQLLGRGMRLLKSDHTALGYVKKDHLCLDYSGTMDAMHAMFNDPILEDAAMRHDEQNNTFITCPVCDTLNGAHARRCKGDDTIGDQPDGRCGHWWQFRTCEDLTLNGIIIERGCGHKNDIAARSCSSCHKYLIDPNEKLSGKAYTDDDWKPVTMMMLDITGKESDGIRVKYWLDSYGLDGKQETAEVSYWSINKGGKRVWVNNFIKKHLPASLHGRAGSLSPTKVIEFGFPTPAAITHRINEKGKSIVNGVRLK